MEGKTLVLEYNSGVKNTKGVYQAALLGFSFPFNLLFRPYLITSRDDLICIQFQAAFSERRLYLHITVRERAQSSS